MTPSPGFGPSPTPNLCPSGPASAGGTPSPPESHQNDPETLLKALGYTLPAASKPVAAYIPARRTGNLLFIAGQVPLSEGKLLFQGSVPGQVTMEQARRCAVQCVLNGLAAVKAGAGSLSAIRQVVRLGVFVCSEPGFYEQPKVANAASELLVELFGERGQHARAAVGSIALPIGAPVEIEFLFELQA